MYALYLCYFTFGFCLSFGAIAMNFEMMETLKFTPVEMTLSMGIVAAPWCIKPIFGFISDKYPAFDWGKRRPYISACGFILGYLYVMLPSYINTKESMVAIMSSISFFLCFSDVCADCITVDAVKTETSKGKTQANCWTSRALGSVLGSTLGGTVYHNYGTRVVFLIAAVPCFMMSAGVWALEKNTSEAPNNVCKKLAKSVYKKRALAFALFAMNLGPNYSPFYTFFLRKNIGYTPEDFQWISMASSLSFLASTFLYKTFLLQYNPLSVMKTGVILGVCCEFIQLFVVTGITDSRMFIIFDSVGQSFFGMLVLMPLIVVVAHNARGGVEGTFYALLMALKNLSSVVADEIGGLIGSMLGVSRENFDNLYILVFICAACDLFIQMTVINNTSFVSYFEVESPRGRKIPRRSAANNTVMSDYTGVMADLGTPDSPDHMLEMSGTRLHSRDSSDHNPENWVQNHQPVN